MLPKDVRGDATDLRVMASHAYSYKKLWYVDCEIVSPKAMRGSTLTQMPVVRGDSPTTKHKHDLLNRIYSNPSTLADIGIDHVRVEKALTAMASVWDTLFPSCHRQG